MDVEQEGDGDTLYTVAESPDDSQTECFYTPTQSAETSPNRKSAHKKSIKQQLKENTQWKTEFYKHGYHADSGRENILRTTSEQSEIKDWKKVIRRASSVILDCEEMRCSLIDDLQEFKDQQTKLNNMKSNMKDMRDRVNEMTANWEFLEQFIQRADAAGSRIKLLHESTEQRFKQRARQDAENF